MTNNSASRAWERIRRGLLPGSEAALPAGTQTAGDTQRLLQELERHLALQAEALFNANAALAAEIRDRQISEARYRILVETSPSAILLTELDGTVIFANPQAAALFGFDEPETMVGVPQNSLIMPRTPEPPTSSQPAQPHLGSAEFDLVRSDGSPFTAEINRATVYDGDGHPSAIIIVLHDVSERKRAEQALHNANRELASLNEHLALGRRLLQELFNGLEDGLLLLNPDGMVQVANRSLAAMLSQSLEDLAGRSWSEIGPRLASGLTAEALIPVQPGSYPRQRLPGPNGCTRLVDIRMIGLDAAPGEPGQFIVHVVDVTDSVRRQEQAMENERFAAAGRLAASVAHEINTPLQTIQTILELIQATPTQDHEPLLADAQQELQRVGRIVRQLLDLYRPAAEAPVDLASLVDRVSLLLGKRIRDQRVEVWRQIAPAPPAFGRADELTQVVINLMVNALDVMSTGGILAVRLYPDAEPPLSVVLEIADTGPGVPHELADRIFEPFFTTKPSGTGLGLAVSRQIVEQHGGSLRLALSEATGSTFEVRLPVYLVVDLDSA